MELNYRFIQLFRLFEDAKRVLVIAHKKPDGDAMGASTALYHWLKREGKDAILFCADLPLAHYKFLDDSWAMNNARDCFEQSYDAVVILDSGDLKYAGVDTLMPLLKDKPAIVNIDHHPTNQHYGDINLVLADASSTSEIIGRFFEANNILIDSAMATSLLTGIFSDTSHFSNSATSSRVVEISGRLVGYGARLSDTANILLKNKDLPALKLWGLALTRLQKNKTYDVVSTYLTINDLREANTDSGAAEGISNFINAVCGGAEIIMVLIDTGDGKIKCSLRSVRRNVAMLAKLLGGGGHVKAAGFTIEGRIVTEKQGFRIV